jgi:hypothetical protein
MSLQYIAEKLFDAIETLALHPGPVKDRLLWAYRDSVSKIKLFANDLPVESRNLFNRIDAAMTKVSPVGDEGSIAATISAMSEADAKKLIQDVILLLWEVSSELAIQSRQQGRNDVLPYKPSSN